MIRLLKRYFNIRACEVHGTVMECFFPAYLNLPPQVKLRYSPRLTTGTS